LKRRPILEKGSTAVPSGNTGKKSPVWAIVLWWLTLVIGVAILLAALPTYALYFQGVNVLIPELPASPFAILSGLASLATVATCLALALLLYRRKRWEPMALFVSFYLIAYGIVMAGPLEFLEGVVPGASDFAIGFIQPFFFGLPTIALLVFFPDGRTVPHWTRWLIPLAAISFILLPLVPAQSASLPEFVLWFLIAVTLAAGIYGQAYRYRRVSSPAERQQTKWVLAGFVAWFLLLMVQSVPYAYLTSLPAGTPPPAWASASAALWWFSLSIVPVCLTIAILRYRLYEIDIVINRALVYGGLTAILAGVYTASIRLFQSMFIAVTGDESDAAIVLTTLVLASAFTPVRTRLQSAVDRRFKDVHDPARRLRALAEEIKQGIWVLHPQQATLRLLKEAVDALGAEGGAAFLGQGQGEREAGRLGRWAPPGVILADLAADGRRMGRIALGPRRDRSSYSPEDQRALDDAGQALARAYLTSPLMRSGPARPVASARPARSRATRRD
jgi:hypothetical protein